MKITRSLIHDRARRLALSNDAQRAVMEWLDGTADPYGDPVFGHTPHQTYWMTKSMYAAFSAVSAFMLRFPGDASELQKLQQFMSIRTNWCNPEKIYTEDVEPGPINAPRHIGRFDKKAIRNALKEKGVILPPNLSSRNMKKIATQHGVL